MATKTNNSEIAATTAKPRKKKGGAGRPFKKGVSGNPKGRPKVPEETKQAFRDASKEACEVLVRIMNDPAAKDSDRIKASEVILDRGWGRPSQAVEVDMTNTPRVIFVDEEKIPD